MSIAEKLTTVAENQQRVYDAGVAAGKAEGGGEETLFTKYGIMYKRNMVVEGTPQYGLLLNAYMEATEMETFSAPGVDSGSSGQSNVLRFCTKLKTAYLPKIRRLGNTFFGSCTALEEVTIGCDEVPVVQINANTFQYCSALVRLNVIGAIETSFSLGWSPLLDDTSIQSIIDGLADLTGATQQALTVHKTVRDKMTETQKRTIASKNWAVVVQGG